MLPSSSGIMSLKRRSLKVGFLAVVRPQSSPRAEGPHFLGAVLGAVVLSAGLPHANKIETNRKKTVGRKAVDWRFVRSHGMKLATDYEL